MLTKVFDITFILLTFNFLMLGCGFTMAKKAYALCCIDKQPHDQTQDQTHERSWLELMAVGAGLLVLLLAGIGLLIAASPYAWRSSLAIVSLFALVIWSTYVFFSGKLITVHRNTPIPQRIFYLGFIALTAISILIANLPVKLPQDLVDGPYVAKVNTLPVRIQFITGNFPADNSIPHVVTQYLLKDISFKEHHPILPGQEVSNRPILMSLATIPYMGVLQMPAQFMGEFPRFEYVRSQWPDFRILIGDAQSYEVSLAVGTLLNALMLLGAAALISAVMPVTAPAALLCVLIALTSPYFLFESLFIWPKSLAGFFIALALLAAIKRKSFVLGALFIGAAYLSHPYAMVFVAGMGLWVALSAIGWGELSSNSLTRRSTPKFTARALNIKPIIVFGAVLLLLFLPWVIWTKLVLQLPASDLIEQNLFLPGQSTVNFIWVRVLNFASTFLPVYFLNYPFNLGQLIAGSAVNVVGACGVVVYAFFIKWIFNLKLTTIYPYIFAIVIPTALLVLIFSNQAVPAVHGLQLPIILIAFLGCIEAVKSLGTKSAAVIFAVVLAGNAYLLVCYLANLLYQ